MTDHLERLTRAAHAISTLATQGAAMTAPRWYEAARAKIGLRETPGPASNPTILGWARRLGAKVLGIAYIDDAVPWCGLFMAEIMVESGITPPSVAVRAKSWATWGQPTAPRKGAVLVFQRPGGGHVGLYAGETSTAYRVLGGNQSDAVTEDAWIAKDRCIAVRWPSGEPLSGERLTVAAGGPLSTNEA